MTIERVVCVLLTSAEVHCYKNVKKRHKDLSTYANDVKKRPMIPCFTHSRGATARSSEPLCCFLSFALLRTVT